jgi:hypothetical protein
MKRAWLDSVLRAGLMPLSMINRLVRGLKLASEVSICCTLWKGPMHHHPLANPARKRSRGVTIRSRRDLGEQPVT